MWLRVEKHVIDIAVAGLIDTHRVVEIYDSDLIDGPCPVVCIEEIDGRPTICWGLADINVDVEAAHRFTLILHRAMEIAADWEKIWAMDATVGGG